MSGGRITAAEDWRAYYARTGARPPRETLVRALDGYDETAGPGFAVDLGCGGGRDTVELLRRGWRVLALDAQAAAIEALRSRDDLPATGRLETVVRSFEDAEIPGADLINSSFALPLCRPASFPGLWARIAAALAPGGRFAGQLYGDRDEWFGDSSITFHTRGQAEALFAGFVIEFFREEEDDALTPRGRRKHWHIFHIAARRTG